LLLQNQLLFVTMIKKPESYISSVIKSAVLVIVLSSVTFACLQFAFSATTSVELNQSITALAQCNVLQFVVQLKSVISKLHCEITSRPRRQRRRARRRRRPRAARSRLGLVPMLNQFTNNNANATVKRTGV